MLRKKTLVIKYSGILSLVFMVVRFIQMNTSDPHDSHVQVSGDYDIAALQEKSSHVDWYEEYKYAEDSGSEVSTTPVPPAEANSTTATTRKSQICSQEHRFATLYKHCPKGAPTLDDIDAMSDAEIMELSQWLFVAENLKTITCMHYKVGWTSQRLILVNNSAKNPTKPVHTPDGKGQFAGMNHLNFSYLKWPMYTMDQRRHIMKTYFKYTFVRHPFDRILSAYIDKLVVEIDPKYEHTGDYYHVMLPKILKKIRPDLLSLPLEKVRVNFSDVVKFIVKGGFDWHYKGTFNDVCHHCKLKYDYIGKIETWDHDMGYIIDTHFPKKRGKSTKGNVNSQKLNVFHKRLKEFDEVERIDLTYLLRKYGDDFKMFGYKWTEANGTFYASCDVDCC